MKRLLAFLLSACLLLAVLPAQAVFEDIGNMEVVNCNEWVSLRDRPSTSAKRLVKVSLGAIVHNCQRVSEDWCYVEYDGYAGYILSKYLEPSDGQSTFSAMLVTILDGAPFYPTIDSTEPMDVIPANTIVRNCQIMDNNRIYVEWGGRCGFISLMHAEVYNEMLHFPREIVLHCNLFEDREEIPAPDVKLTYTSEFPLKNYAYSEYVQEEQEERAEFVIHSDKTINHVHLFSVSLRSMDDETGEAIFDGTLEHIQYQIDPAHPLSVSAAIYGMMPNLVIGYQDARGSYQFAFVEISGEDGSLLLKHF